MHVGGRKVHIFLVGELSETDDVEDVGIGGIIILK
jgi:hypothetical protein